MTDDELGGRRLALLGFGVENQAVGRWLAGRGLAFAVCDAEPDRHAAGSPWDEAVCQWRLGPGAFDRLHDFDVAFRSPGLPWRRPELAAARARGVTITSQTALFLGRCPVPVVGITGTKGKGTTACLLLSILQRAPAPAARVGGNIGTPPLTFLDDLRADEIVVLELSSFQLQDLERSPHGAVLLPVGTDHLDHHADRGEYLEAKGTLCRFQSPGDWVVAAAECATAAALARRSPGRQLRFGAQGEPDGDACWAADGQIWWREGGAAAEAVGAVADVRLRGRHNLANACAAVAAARLCGVAAQGVAAGLRAFTGLPHRLQELGTRAGILYVNDSLATTPEAAVAGLAAYAPRRVALIAGGSSKGAGFADLGRAIAAGAAGLVTLGQEGPAIAAAARAAGYAGPIAADCASMAQAVTAAADMATPGGVVLLSPGCASFGMFTSYAERGAAFHQAAGWS